MAVKVSRNQNGTLRATFTISFWADGSSTWDAIRHALREREEILPYLMRWGLEEMFPIQYDESFTAEERDVQSTQFHSNLMTGLQPKE